MAATPTSGGELSITVKPADSTGAGGDEFQQSESRSAGVVRMKLKALNKIVFGVVFLEWVGNAAGTLAFIWATVVLLGGFCSLLTRKDFWFATVMVFMEGSSWVFIRKDVSISHWIIFGSTCAFRWKDFSVPRISVGQTFGKLSVVSIGVGIALVPDFSPEVASSMLKVAFLVIVSQLLTRLERGSPVHMVLLLLGIACVSGAMYGYVKTAPQRSSKTSSKHDTLASLKAAGLAFSWLFGTVLLTGLACGILSCLRFMRNTIPLLWFKIFIASVLTCLPFLQEALACHYKYRYWSIPAAVTLLVVSNEVFWGAAAAATAADDDESSSDCSLETAERETSDEQEDSTSSSSDGRLLLQIVETILPILFFWSVMFPLPAAIHFSLRLSFYTLVSVIAGVLLANLQIPVAFLQVLLSILRLHSLADHHLHDYSPLPADGTTSPNLVPSVVIFYMLEVCQGSSNLLAAILGFISFLRRMSLARDLGFQQEWGAKAISLYFRQAYQARMETGLFHCQDQDQEKHTLASLESFAIRCLGCTSSSRQMQIVGLRILHNSLQQRGDSQSNKKLITEMVKDSENFITNIIGLISRCYLTVKENSGGLQHHKKTIEQMGQHQKKYWAEQMEVARFCLELVRTVAINGGKISARFRKDLSENPFFLDSLDRILNLKNFWGWLVDDLREQAMGIVATLAVDEVARKEIGSNKSIILSLMRELEPSMYDDRSSLRMAAGEALANLTINSADNCWAILLVDTEHNLFIITNLIHMLDDEYYICVAANLLHNLCANSRDMLIDLGASMKLESALSKAMEIIRTKEGKQLEAALCVASQIGNVIPEYFAEELDPDTDDAVAEQLVTKLVDTLKSNLEPCLEYPRIRRVLVEVVISIVELCPGYIKIFRAKGAKDALDMVKGTPSRFEKYRVFVHDEGVVPERLTMRDLVDHAKRLIYDVIPTPGSRNQGTSPPCTHES